MLRVVSLAVAILASASIAQAQMAPLPRPGSDFEADYRLTGQMAGTMSYRFAVQQRRLRVDMAVQGVTTAGLYDMGEGAIRLWSSAMPGMVMRVRAGASDKARGQRTAEVRQVLGAECRIWKIESGEACFTEDGIPLAMTGGGMQTIATRFMRRPQEPPAFQAPAGQVMDLPALAGMKIPMPW